MDLKQEPNFSLEREKFHFLSFLGICLLFVAVQVTLQWYGGAFGSEFGRYPDEAAHYVTSLLLRDYIASGNWDEPLSFAENYYIHYPKVAIGHWPPFFHAVQATWILLLSPSHLSILLLLTLLTTLLGGTVYLAIRRDFGVPMGIAMGLLMLALPLIQQFSGMVMTEILLGLLMIWAVLCFGEFLNTERWQYSITFGLCATLAILTKGNGLALGLVPPLSLLLSRRFHLLQRSSFWYPAILVFIFCAPFYWLTLDMVRNGWQEEAPTMEFTIAAVRYYSYSLVKITGISLFLLVMLGFFVRVIRPAWNRKIDGRWAAVSALPLSVLIFQSLVPSGLEARHLIPAVPALLMFLAAGVVVVAEHPLLGRLRSAWKKALLIAAIIVGFVLETFFIPINVYHGFGDIAQRLLSGPEFEDSVFLVSSDSSGEGAFISEVAMREKRPGHVVLRASKILGTSRWNGSDYKALHDTSEEMMAYLEGIPVEIIVMDLSNPLRRKHQRLLKETLEAYPHRWELLGMYPLTRQASQYADSLRVYRLLGAKKMARGVIRINMSGMLNKTLEKK